MDLVEIKRFLDLTEAQAAAAALRASGMSIHVQNEHYGQTEPYLQIALGGFGIYAAEADARDARAYLAAVHSEATADLPAPPPQNELVTTGVVVLAAATGILAWLAAPLLRRRRQLPD
jgi:hypothetical protein